MQQEQQYELTQEELVERFHAALDCLEQAKPFAKLNHLGRFLDASRRLMAMPGGVEPVYEQAHRFDGAGVFLGSDWQNPEILSANLVPHTFQSSDASLITLECLSELRIFAIVNEKYFHPLMAAEQASHFLMRVLALNLSVLFGIGSEATRQRSSVVNALLSNHLSFLADHIGFENILDAVVSEVWRLLRQRPVQVDFVKAIITRAAECIHNPDIRLDVSTPGIEGLITALHGPTEACREDPGIEVYRNRIQAMHLNVLEREALAFARAMHDTGLVSPYHAGFVRHLLDTETDLLPAALGLSSTGRDGFYCYRDLVTTLVDQCVHPETCQAILGMSGLLERGILYQPGVAPSLWRQTKAVLAPQSKERLAAAFGTAHPPLVYLMMGIINVLGQPLGLGQGNNPVCQSTRAISMWAYSDPDFLLQLTRWAGRDNSITMSFEGQAIHSGLLPPSGGDAAYYDLDPVSTLLVPHLDRIYFEMGRRTQGRGDDPHRWINPEFHGWRVNRGFAIAVDVNTNLVKDLHEFVSMFLSLYHPFYNGDTPLAHLQPAGIAVTDGRARYVGWHAITILRVMLDHENVMRVYFFNPNNDSGQDWGHGVVVSTHGCGEQYGESSLPIEQFCSRLYIFHYDPSDYYGPSPLLPAETVQSAVDMALNSWVATRG